MSRAVLLSDVVYVSLDKRRQRRGLYPQQRILLRHLIDRGGIRMHDAVDLLWGDREDGGPLIATRHVRALVFEIRHNLRPGWYIPYYEHKMIRLLFIQPLARAA